MEKLTEKLPLTEAKVDQINRLSNEWIKAVHQVKGVQLKYDEDSVQYMNQYIEKKRLEHNWEDYKDVRMVIGFFLGNCIIQKYGGHWVNPDYPEVEIKIEHISLIVNPLDKVKKHFEKGSLHSIESLFIATGLMLKKGIGFMEKLSE